MGVSRDGAEILDGVRFCCCKGLESRRGGGVARALAVEVLVMSGASAEMVKISA